MIEMKKILTFLLVIACVFSMAACTPGGGGATLDVTAFKTAVSATNPTNVEITTKLETEIGDLNGEFDVTYAADGSATIEYSYEKFNALAAGVTEAKSTLTGTVTLNADGSYSDGGTLVGNVSAAGGFTLNLDTAKLKDGEVSGNTLTATVEKANTEAVLGVAIDADVEMILTKSDTAIVSLVITYTTTAGPATITCSYQ